MTLLLTYEGVIAKGDADALTFLTGRAAGDHPQSAPPAPPQSGRASFIIIAAAYLNGSRTRSPGTSRSIRSICDAADVPPQRLVLPDHGGRRRHLGVPRRAVRTTDAGAIATEKVSHFLRRRPSPT